MHLEYHSCNVPVPHHQHGADWVSFCHNPVDAKCYKCDRFYCCDHIRKHECDGVDEHPATD